MALTNLLSLFSHTKFLKSVSAIKIKEDKMMYPLPEISKIWFKREHISSNEEDPVKAGIYIQFSPMELTTSDSEDQTIEKDEFMKNLNETAELTITDVAGKEEPTRIPLKLTTNFTCYVAINLLFSKEEPTETVLNRIRNPPTEGLFLSFSYKISDSVSVEYSCIVYTVDCRTDDIYLYDTDPDESGITPVVRISKEESDDIPDLPSNSSSVEKYIPISFWNTQAGVTFLIISIISVLFFIIPTIWRVYRTLFNK